MSHKSPERNMYSTDRQTCKEHTVLLYEACHFLLTKRCSSPTVIKTGTQQATDWSSGLCYPIFLSSKRQCVLNIRVATNAMIMKDDQMGHMVIFRKQNWMFGIWLNFRVT